MRRTLLCLTLLVMVTLIGCGSHALTLCERWDAVQLGWTAEEMLNWMDKPYFYNLYPVETGLDCYSWWDSPERTLIIAVDRGTSTVAHKEIIWAVQW